jgi:hypothetical protein
MAANKETGGLIPNIKKTFLKTEKTKLKKTKQKQCRFHSANFLKKFL